MQFVNIVVHSVEDMNFRVHLQHEFTLIGLDMYLEVSLAIFITNSNNFRIFHLYYIILKKPDFENTHFSLEED